MQFRSVYDQSAWPGSFWNAVHDVPSHTVNSRCWVTTAHSDPDAQEICSAPYPSVG